MKRVVTIIVLLSIPLTFDAFAGGLPEVSGKVEFNGQPMVGVPVQLLTAPTDDQTIKGTTIQYTDEKGAYRFYNIPSGRYTLKVSPDPTSVPKTFKNVTLSEQQSEIADVDLATGQMLTPPGNFHSVIDGAVYRGARPKDEGQIEWLRRNLGVKTIIDLQGADPWWAALAEPGEARSQRLEECNWSKTDNHINWVNEPLNSINDVHCDEAERINQILDIIRDPKNQPVYFHCEHGQDRTGLIAALDQVFYENPPLTPAAAHTIMLDDGHNTLFCGSMDDYFNLATTTPMSLDKLDSPQCQQTLPQGVTCTSTPVMSASNRE